MGFLGILNPKNAVESTGLGFQEGLVRVDESEFVVYQYKPREPREGDKPHEPQQSRKPNIALRWLITRLDQDSQEPLNDEEGNPVQEELFFGLGGSSLTDRDGNMQITPGTSDEPPSDFGDVKDLGDEVGTAGPTLYFHNQGYQVNKAASIEYLFASLTTGMKPNKETKNKDEFNGCGAPESVVDACWAPAFKGLVAHMTSYTSKNVMGKPVNGKDPSPTNYKIVDKIVAAPWEKKGKKGEGKAAAAEKKADKAEKGSEKGSSKKESVAAPAASGDAENTLKGMLAIMSGEKSGETLTMKELRLTVNRSLEAKGKSGEEVLEVIGLLKNGSNWLTKNAAALDMEVEEADGKIVSVTFN